MYLYLCDMDRGTWIFVTEGPWNCVTTTEILDLYDLRKPRLACTEGHGNYVTSVTLHLCDFYNSGNV